MCLCLCLSFCGCNLLGSSDEDSGVDVSTIQGKIDNSVLQYPATNSLFRYNVYTYYVTISECLTTDPIVAIPDTIDDLPVIGIENNAFNENQTVKSITIGKNVANIGEYAFAECLNLESVVTPSGLLTIGRSAFAGCEKLRNIVVPMGVKTIPQSAFSGCTSLKSVTIEESEQTNSSEEETTKGKKKETGRLIEPSAFAGCPVLSYVWIPGDFTEIAQNAFSNSMEYLTIYGYATSQAAIFSATNLIDFVVLDKLKFSDMVNANINNYPTVNNSIQTSDFKVTLNNVSNLKTVKNIIAKEGHTFVIFEFSVANISDKPKYFNSMFVTGSANNVKKYPVYFGESEIGSNILAGTIAPGTEISGYIAFQVNENYSYVLVDFNDIAGFETIDSIMAAYK